MKTLQLKPNVQKRIRGGYLWIFSNEVLSNLREFEPGEIVRIVDDHGHFVAIGYVNPRSLICARILTVEDESTDEHFFVRRLESALAFRKTCLPDTNCCRIVYGESDFLPGLVVDKYENVLVAQSLTAGMDALWNTISHCLQTLFNPTAIVLRNDVGIRKLEGLELTKTVHFGHLDSPSEVSIGGMRYFIDFLESQKTGFFLDQRFNHVRTAPYVRQRRVLDCFSYVGAWSLHAARFGASEVIALDISEPATAQARTHASINAIEGCTFRTADVFDALKDFNARSETFDVVILDPPSFAKSRAEVPDAIRGYREINRRAAKALSDGGTLVTCSCSHLVEPDTFRNTVLQGIQAAGRVAVILERPIQAADHPCLLSMRETEYLKCLILRVFKA